MPINTASIRRLLRPGLAMVFSNTTAYPLECFELFSKHKSDKQQEITVEVKMLPVAQMKAEGDSIAFEGMAERYATSFLNQTAAIGYIITREACLDCLYKDEFPMGAVAMRDSLLQYKNIQGASILNNGFSSSYPLADGVPFFSTLHPVDGGFVANTPTANMGLNETSIQDALKGIQRFKSASGIKVVAKPQKLVVPTDLQFAAEVLLGSKYQTGTANNNISSIFNQGYFPRGYTTNHFLTNQANWYILTDVPGMKYFEREPVITNIFTDIDTNNLKVSAFERYCFGVDNFRSAWGVQGI